MKTLLKWLRGAIAQGAVSIELKSNNFTLQTVEVESTNDDEIIALLDGLMEFAQEETNNSGKVGPNRFKLKAEFEDKKPLLSPTFSLRTENEDEEFESEGTSKDDLISQQMRHNEVLMRMMTMGNQKTIEYLTQSNAKLLDAFNVNIDKRLDLVEQQEKLLSEQGERELALEKAKRDEERKDKIVSKVVPLLPVAINRFLNSRKLPEPVNPVIEMLKDVAKSIPAEKFVEIQAVLGPDVAVKIAEIFSSLEYDNNDKQDKAENE